MPRGAKELEKLIDRSLQLKAWSPGWEYRANLRKDGTIRYADRVFDSPSSAARVARGRKVNGWTFWHYYDRQTRAWVPLRRLRD